MWIKMSRVQYPTSFKKSSLGLQSAQSHLKIIFVQAYINVAILTKALGSRLMSTSSGISRWSPILLFIGALVCLTSVSNENVCFHMA